MVGCHHLDLGAQPSPEFCDPLDRRHIRVLGWRHDAPAFVEQGCEARLRSAAFGAGHRVRGDDGDAGQRLGQHAQHFGLGRSDIADDRFPGQIGGEFRRCRAHCADWNAQDDEIGIDHRRAARSGNVVAQLQAIGDRADVRVGIIAGQSHRRHLHPYRARDRRSDQPQADDGDAAKGRLLPPVFKRCREHQPAASTRSRRAAATPCVSSAVPMVMRKACGRPCPGSQRTI